MRRVMLAFLLVAVTGCSPGSPVDVAGIPDLPATDPEAFSALPCISIVPLRYRRLERYAWVGTIFDSPFEVLEVMAMMGFPPLESAAPRMKSIWPPTPEYIRNPIESAQTWPVRSISIAELMAVTLGFCLITAVSLT